MYVCVHMIIMTCICVCGVFYFHFFRHKQYGALESVYVCVRIHDNYKNKDNTCFFFVRAEELLFFGSCSLFFLSFSN